MDTHTPAKQDWIAIFKSDFSAKRFTQKANSDEVFFWIKEIPSKRVHTAISTGNSYELRNFKIYDKNNVETPLDYGGKWKCSVIVETHRDYFGSLLQITIIDPKGDIKKIGLHQDVYCKRQILRRLTDEQSLSCILYYLKSLNSYKDWEHLNTNPQFFENKLPIIPLFVKKTVYTRLKDFNIMDENFQYEDY
jgi:hypothetical protein